MKYFAVSDVHDHYSLLLTVLDEKGFDPDNEEHKLIICGDAFYNGPEPAELFEYLKTLHEKGRLIFVYGNHDYELLDCLEKKKFGRGGNRRCAEMLTGTTDLTDEELAEECEKIGFTDFLKTVPVTHFETEHYVFTHGFIPAKCDDWRNATEKQWRSAASLDGMRLSMHDGISVPGKKVVFGHYCAARCYIMQNASEEDWQNKIYTSDKGRVEKLLKDEVIDAFRPFYGETFIAIDPHVKGTGFINCIILED